MKVLTGYTNAVLMALIIATALSVAGCHKTAEFDQGLPSDEGIEGWFDFGEGPGEDEAAEGEAVVGEEAEPEAEIEAEAEVEPEPEPESELEPYSVQSQQIMKRDSSLIEFTDKPIPLILQIITKLSRPLSADEKSQFETEFHLQDSDGNDVDGSFAWVNDEEVRFAPKRRLDYGKTYTASPAATTDHFTTMTKGDINGDGVADVLVGEPGWSSGKGRIMVVGGAALPTVLSVFKEGENVGDGFGAAVAIAGDINADGYEDVVVGAPGFDNDSLVDAGKAYVYFGPSLSDVPIVILGDNANASVGSAVAGCDTNGDGFIEVLAGAPRYNSSRGRVYVLKGGFVPSTTFIVEAPTLPLTQQFGHSIACLGSHDEIPGDEVIIGSPLFQSNRGRISIHRGDELAELTYKVGEAPGDRFGWSVASVSDLNGDKRNDILVGAPFKDSERGMVYVFIAKDNLITASPTATDEGEVMGNHYGEALMAISDITGDGKEELLIGAPRYNVTQGKIYLAKINASDLVIIAERQGDAPDAGLGNAIARVRDLSGDNKDDVIVGESTWNSHRGKALIIKSDDMSSLSLVEVVGTDPGYRLGSSLAGK